jgi:CheY-like chemotaxis protein
MMTYAFAGTRSRFTEAMAAQARGRIQTPRKPNGCGASAKRSKRKKSLAPRRQRMSKTSATGFSVWRKSITASYRMALVRILIADDHEVIRKGLRQLLETRPGWQVCGEATNGTEAIEKTRELRPDLVIMDIALPKVNGLTAAATIMEFFPETVVVAFSMHDSKGFVESARRMGFRGFVCKSESGDMLLRAIDSAVDKKTFFHN